MGADSTTRQAKLADAGLLIANGSSVKQALIKQGYAPSTAAKPKGNGITARACLDAAAIEYPDAVPTKLVNLARRAMGAKLRSWVNEPAKLTKAKGGEVARMADVVERWYGSHEPDDPSSRRFDHRLAAFADAVEEAKRRGLLDSKGRLTGKRAPTIDVDPTCD